MSEKLRFFKPYEGREPYLFISYSHRDSEKVIRTIKPIQDRMYRLWYDEGIPAGSDWPRNIAVHMNECRMVLFFLSKTALASPNCLSEIATAAKQGKTILLMKLEDIPETEYSPKWKAALQSAVLIEPSDKAEERTEHILNCPLLTEEFLGTEEDFREIGGGGGKRTILATVAMVIATLLLVTALGVVAGLSTGYIKVFETPSPTPTDTPAPLPRRRPPRRARPRARHPRPARNRRSPWSRESITGRARAN